MIVIVPIVVLVGYWFLVLGPKRAEVTKADASLAKQEKRLTKARLSLGTAETSKTTFANDYAEIVRLGKAVPTKLDMPTVLVQLDEAAKGTGLRFVKVKAGERTAPTAAAAQPPAAPGAAPAAPAAPAAAGGTPAASAPGKTAENAGNSVNNANATSAKAEKSGAAAAGAPASTPAAGGTAASRRRGRPRERAPGARVPGQLLPPR